MPFSHRNPLAAYVLRRRAGLVCLDQVANARDSTVDLTPASKAPAAAVDAAWLPVTSGQDIPMLGERVDAEPCDDV